MSKHYTVVEEIYPAPKEASCKGKKRYRKNTAIYMAKKLRSYGRMKRVRVYPCGHCTRWHIANDNNNRKETNR